MNVQTSQAPGGILGELVACDPQNTNLLVQKYDYDGIVRGGVIVVHETQRAALYINGVRETLIEPGRFVCDESANIPVLDEMLSVATKGETTYPVSVWFVSTTVENNLLWGVRVVGRDADYAQTINVGLNGSAVVRVAAPETFLDKFVGTLSRFTAEDVAEKIKAWLMTPIRTAAARAFAECGSMIRFQTELPAVQARVREELNAEIGELYGLEFTRFEIRSVESDDYQQIVAEERAGTAEARRLARLGVDYATERRFGILDKAASNEGAGTLMGAGLGLGAGMPMGAAFGEMLRQTAGAGTGTPAGTPFAAAGFAGASAAAATPPPIPPSAAAGAPAYFVALGNVPTGPFSPEQLVAEIRRGALGAGTLVWRAGMASWIPIATDPAFAPLFFPSK